MKILIVNNDPEECAVVCSYFVEQGVLMQGEGRIIPAISRVGVEDIRFVLIDTRLTDFTEAAARLAKAMEDMGVPYAYISSDRDEADAADNILYRNGNMPKLFDAVMEKIGQVLEV